MCILTANRLLLLTILLLVPFHTVGTVVLPNSDVAQSAGSTPKGGQVRSSGLEMLTDTEGIDFNPYLLTALVSVRRNWYAVIPPSVGSGQQGTNTAEFRILQDGKVSMDFLKLTVHSGNEEFDKASLWAIRASTPFSHLPETFSGPFIVVHITFYYNVPRAPGAVVNGLQMSVSHDDAAQGSDKALQFTMMFRNRASQEIIITPGTTQNCGHEGSKTDLVKMNLTEASGIPHRHLEFLGSGPPYQAWWCAGRIDLFEVAVKPGESITLPLDLTKYLDLSNSKQYDQAHFHAGTYWLQMELTGPPFQYIDGRPTPRGVWVGTVTSNVLKVCFDKEFAAPVSDLPK